MGLGRIPWSVAAQILLARIVSWGGNVGVATPFSCRSRFLPVSRRKASDACAARRSSGAVLARRRARSCPPRRRARRPFRDAHGDRRRVERGGGQYSDSPGWDGASAGSGARSPHRRFRRRRPLRQLRRPRRRRPLRHTAASGAGSGSAAGSAFGGGSDVAAASGAGDRRPASARSRPAAFKCGMSSIWPSSEVTPASPAAANAATIRFGFARAPPPTA